MRYINSFIGLMLMMILVIGCGERQDRQERFDEDGPPPAEQPTQTQPPADAEQDRTAVERGEEPQQEFVQQMELRLDQAEDELEMARQDTEALGEEQVQDTGQYDQIEARIDQTRDQLAELENAGAENWEQLSQEVMNNVNTIEEEIQTLRGDRLG